jgi:hypothetical protein
MTLRATLLPGWKAVFGVFQKYRQRLCDMEHLRKGRNGCLDTPSALK